MGTAPPIDWNVTSFRTRTACFFFLTSRLVNFTTEIFGYSRALERTHRDGGGGAGGVCREPAGGAYSWQSALAIALAGLLSAGLEVPPKSRQFIPLLIGGVWLLAHGVPTLVRYLRTYPAPKGDGE